MGWGNESLFKWSRSLDQDGRHAHIYYKNMRNSSSLDPKWLMNLKVDMQHWIIEYYKVCSNDYNRMTLTYFMARSSLVP